MATALLIVDDLGQRAAGRAALLRADLAVVEEATGFDALARARELRPNLVLLALRLRGADVPGLCRSLRAEHPCTATAIVVLSSGRAEASDNEDEAARITEALASGAEDSLSVDEVPSVASSRIRRLLHFQQLAAMAILNEQLAQVGRLVAGIVHEIRAPLTVIRGNAELMALELGEDHAAKVWIEPILRNARTLQVRLGHLMAAVRVGPSDPQPLDVVPLVRESISLFEKGIDTRRDRIAVDFVDATPPVPPPLVLVDAGRLIQVVLNLLANAHDAILSDGPEGRIEARVESDPDGREVRVIIQDDGPGVGPGFIGRIFEPFFTTKPGGTGYGLYLAAEILREHGGRLTVRNPDGGGACFSIHLPAAPSK